MSHPIPKSVTLNQIAEAWVAFFDALGIPNGANYTYASSPVVVTEDAIYVNATPVADWTNPAYPDGVPALWHPQGDEFAELVCMVRIEIER